MVYGPVRPPGSVVKNGKTYVPSGRYQGPVRQGRDVEQFRRTGSSSGSSGSSSGGSSNSSARRAAAAKAAQEKAATDKVIAQKAATDKAIAEKAARARMAAKTTRDLTIIEQQRINNLKQNARKNQVVVRDSSGKIKRIQNTYFKAGNKVVENINYITGKSFIRTFKNGRLSGGLSSNITKAAPATAAETASKVKFERVNLRGKVRVIFPNGQQAVINSRGRVSIGARLAGNNYVFENGKVVRINNKWADGRDIFEPVLTVEAIKRKSGVSGLIQKLNEFQQKKSTSSIRNKQRKLKNELSLLGVTVVTTFVAGVIAYGALPSAILKLVRNPSQIKAIPGAIARSGRNIGQMMRISPTEFIGVVAGEVVLLKGTGSILKRVGKVSTKIKNIVKPVLNKADKTRFTVSGNTIKLAGGTSSTAESLAKQASRAGKKSVPVTALSDDIFSLMKRKRTVGKPIPGENLLSPGTKRLLKKFDAGKASRTEVVKLDRLIKIETKGAGSLLERVTFADPAGRVRQSRLGIGSQKDASLIDVLAGDFTFRANKPIVMVFDKTAIEAFPKSLRSVARKFKAGRTLTQSEADALLKFQLKQSGKWKPIGALSKESEIVLAPGEIIRKVKKIGSILVNGKRVPVVKVRVVKAIGELKSLLGKFNKNRISAAELKKLEKMLGKTSGFKNKLSRSGNARPVARFPGVIGARRGIRSRVTRRTATVKRRAKSGSRAGGSKTRAGKRVKVPKRTTRATSRTPKKTRTPTRPGRTTRTPIRTTPRPPRRGRGAKVPPKPPVVIRIPKKFKQKKLKKAVDVYYVKEKVRGRILNLNPRPLPLKEARDFLAYRIDNRLSKSAWFEPLGKSKDVLFAPKVMKGYFLRNKAKLRPFKIRVGKKRAIRNGYIEKRKFFRDTPGENKQLKRLRKPLTLSQKKALVARLRKGRMKKRK